MNTLNEKYHLPSRIKLEELASGHIAIVKRIKSRIIQKDAQKILETAQTIRSIEPEVKVSLVCNDNICSKSVALLLAHGVEVIKQNSDI